MTEEEKKAIERLSNGKNIDLISLLRKLKKEGIKNFVITKQEIIYTVLNLIQKQQAEIAKKDKIIDEMAIAIGYEPLPTEEYCIFRDFNCPVVGGNRNCKECIKQYFEKKVEDKQWN